MPRALSHYELDGELGRGGMGVVYSATDTRLGRRVAIKVLPSEATADPDRKRRFLQEARAASALNHPNIVTIYEVDEDAGATFIAMELVDGTPLDRVLAQGALPVANAIEYGMQIAAALDAAHRAGIVHRDIKPSNIMIARDGRAKVLDFGVAKLTQADTDVTVTSMATRVGMIVGTAAYMAPEQAQGRAVDARCDIYSLGAVLYEMITGRRALEGVTGLPRELEPIVRRALAAAPDARYPSAAALRADLAAVHAHLTHPREPVWQRPSVLVPTMLVLIGVIAVGTWQTVQARGVRWARTEAIPEMERIEGTPHALEALQLARRAERYAPDDVQRVRDRWWTFAIDSDPKGATVEIRMYTDVGGAWERVGVTPVSVPLPVGYYRVRVSKPGYASAEVSTRRPQVTVALTLEASAPHEMVRVPGGSYTFGQASPVTLSDFWIDRLEVSNREYKAFVDAGGYREPQYWRERFVDGAREIPFADAIARFRDTTGRPGPATWELGRYPEGRDEYPVGGISWFEAAAYAQFAGKQLPTLYHWYKASGAGDISSEILLLSNFDGKGPARTGERQGVGPWGTLDMAGNVKEWCANVDPETSKRYILGGAWDEPSYRFNETDAHNPWDRAPTFGVRLMRATGDLSEMEKPVTHVMPDPNSVVPASDTEFEFYKRFYTYDRTPLDAKVTSVDDSHPDFRVEVVDFAAAYGGERMPAHVFLPKHVSPPFQTIVYFPSSFARIAPPGTHLDYSAFDFIVKSGRALVYPIYKGTFERHTALATGPNASRDMSVQWAKDFLRTVDYLETRTDIDKTHLGFYGLSMGAYFAPIPLALDSRIKAAALVAGGLRYKYPAEVQPANFMPHVDIPVLTINGRDDFETNLAAQDRMLQLFGTPPDRKKHVALEGGHLPYDSRAMIREVLDWYDRWLGPVH